MNSLFIVALMYIGLMVFTLYSISKVITYSMVNSVVCMFILIFICLCIMWGTLSIITFPVIACKFLLFCLLVILIWLYTLRIV